MRAGSLRWRLMFGAALTIVVTLTVALFTMSLLFSRHIERRVVEDLQRDANRVIAQLHLDARGVPQSLASLSDSRYETPASGRYWQLSSKSGNTRSLSLWDDSLPVATGTGPRQWHVSENGGPFDQRVILLERTIQVGTNEQVRVQFAQDMGGLYLARNQFRWELGLFLAILGLLLMLAASLQVHLGLKPLKRVRSELERMRRSPSERMDDHHPSEVMPLTSAINHLAEARERDLARARRRAADLAHSLKTPLAAMSALNRRARAAGQSDLADDFDRVIISAGAALEAELARSRAAAIRDEINISHADPAAVADRIISVLQRTEFGAGLVYILDIVEGMRLPIANDDLMEVLGALLENATRFARRQVRIGGTAGPGWVTLTVEDDGPGLGISEEEALQRGGRLDETGSGGHGLGLSIARDITEATQGEVHLGRSELGGLQIHLRWPHSRQLN